MKRSFGLIVMALAVLAASPAGAGAANSRDGGARPITIESWLQVTPTTTGLGGTVKACFKLKGGLVDQGGKPRWTNEASYADRSAPATQCGAARPVGAAILVGPMANLTIYAVHTYRFKKGRIFIQFAGVYDFAETFQGTGTWVITGGTGAYRDLEGEGTVAADATTFPYVRHTLKGAVHFADED